MKRLLAVTALLAICNPAAAEFYFGAKLGYLTPDVDSTDGTSAASVNAGYELGDFMTADAAVEAEYTQSIEGGDVDLPGGLSDDWDFSSFGLFGAVRSAGPVYVKGRAGIVRNELEVSGVSEDATGGAIGAGVGFSLLGLEMSVDWTRYLEQDDLDSVDYFTIGARF